MILLYIHQSMLHHNYNISTLELDVAVMAASPAGPQARCNVAGLTAHCKPKKKTLMTLTQHQIDSPWYNNALVKGVQVNAVSPISVPLSQSELRGS